MGIKGLLPFLKPYIRKTHIEEFNGQTVGVDAMCWMHKGAFACSQDLVIGRDTDKFVRFFLRMCEILRCNRIKPVIVFDGEKLPAKAKEDQRRAQVREVARMEALELLQARESGHSVDEKLVASKCEQAIKVTRSMISRLQCALKELCIDFLVAPYEADAQLAYMCRTGWISTAISEDSDLLAYGCPSTFFKMDKYGNGEHVALPCLQVDHKGMPQLPEGAGEKKSAMKQKKGKAFKGGKSKAVKAKEAASNSHAEQTDPPHALKTQGKKGKSDQDVQAAELQLQTNLDRWSPEKFAEFCVFCGTDYKEPDTHIKNFGIKTAFSLMCRHPRAEDVLQVIFKDKKFQDRLPCATEEYLPRYRSVVAVFWHHVVFNPRRGECTSIASSFPLTWSERLVPELALEAVCGAWLPRQEALQVAKGLLDPRLRTPKHFEPLTRAERHAIDLLLDEKRREQAEFRISEAAKREEEARLEEARRVEEADVAEPRAEAEMAEDVPAEANADAQQVPEINLLPQDLKKLMDIRDQCKQMNSEHASNSKDKPKAFSNPFGRKRPASPCQNRANRANRAIAAGPVRRTPMAQPVPVQRGDSQADDSAKSAKQSRVAWKHLESHPRGGGAAKAAAEAVLAQRGMPQLEDAQNRSKLRFFFQPTSEKAQAKEPSKLSSWNPRAWQEEEVPGEKVGRNMLSMRQNRKFMYSYSS